MENKGVVVGIAVAVGAASLGAYKWFKHVNKIEKEVVEDITSFQEFGDILNLVKREEFLSKRALLIKEVNEAFFTKKAEKVHSLLEDYLRNALGYRYKIVEWNTFEDSLVSLNEFITKNLRHFRGKRNKVVALYDEIIEIVAQQSCVEESSNVEYH